jgi:signal transduction histidine kinase
MGDFLQHILATLTTFPGNLVYHLIVAFSVAGAFQAGFNLWRTSGFPQGRRMVIGLGLLLAARMVVFLGAIFAGNNLVGTPNLLPILERSVTSLSLIVIIWLWAFPEPDRTADAATGSLAALTIFAAIFSVVWWGDNRELYFNQTLLDSGWEIYSITLLLLGITLLLVRKPNSWGVGMTMLGILAVGHLSHVLNPLPDSDIAGSVRLAQMAAYPILLALPHRFQIPTTAESKPQKTEPLYQERVQYGVNPNVLNFVLSIGTQKTFNKVCQKMTEMIANVMLADICLALLPDNQNGQIIVQCGYDLIRQKNIPRTVFEKHDLPMLVSAMERSIPLRLPASSTSQDLITFGKQLQVGRAGHLLASYVTDKDHKLPVGIVLLSPYSNRSWSKEDQAFLSNITDGLVQILQHNRQWISHQDELNKNRKNLQAIQTLLEETQNENVSLRGALNDLSKQSLQEQDATTIPQSDIQHQSLEEIKRLQAENLRLEEFIENLPSGNDAYSGLVSVKQLEEELHQALEEIAQLKSKLVTADQELLNLQFESSDTSEPTERSDQQNEVFTSIAQELRQPMSSIIGYTDLLLGESVGILGALQRKFLERVKASTERMQVMLDDLFQFVSIESDELQLNPELVNLGNIIDEAILATSPQLRDRHIILRVDLPEKLPDLKADRDALGQIFFHLLKNAGDASPIEGEVLLRASTYLTDDNQEYVLIQFADQGGGIPIQDLPRVFSRSYRADNPLIEGVGDNGVGLSIAKTLVEAHSGRIWVDSESGKGSTFSVLIPLLNGASGEPSL